MNKWHEAWNNLTPVGRRYGQLLYRRAVGELPEMESSKAAARQVARKLTRGDKLLDVGCGPGHYLKSLQNVVPYPFKYVGVDTSSDYLALARRAFVTDATTIFEHGDIFSLPFQNDEFDIVMCNNVLLHLPTVAKPISELIRVSRKHVIVRMLIGQQSFVVQCVSPAEDGDDFDDDGQPRAFHFLNIYSEKFIKRLASNLPNVASVKIEVDGEFTQSAVTDTGAVTGAWNATRIIGDAQVVGSIILPWAWLQIRLG